METELPNLSKAELVPLLMQANKALSQMQHKTKNMQLALEYFKLKKQHLTRQLFGQKREHLETCDLPGLFFVEKPGEVEQGKEETVEKITYERKRPRPYPDHPGRKPLPEHLPVKEKIIEPEGDITNMVKIGEQVTDILEYELTEFYITRYIRPKYASKGKESIGIAKLPSRTFNKCMAGNSLRTSIISNKYADLLVLLWEGGITCLSDHMKEQREQLFFILSSPCLNLKE